MRRLLKLGIAAAALLLGLAAVVAGWAVNDTPWGEFPPASLVREPLRDRLPAPLAEAAAWLPERAAAPLDVATLPPWHAPARLQRQVTRKVANVSALREAMSQALPGDVIELQPGDHVIKATLVVGQGGRADAPIVLRGAAGARLLSETVEAIKLTQPHWVIEHLEIVGTCARVTTCEHAIHVVGHAEQVWLSGLQLRNFNAAIKVNGEDGAWPDHGRVTGSLLANDAPRPGDAPSTPFDLVGASDWRFEDNRVWGVAKQGGDRVAYGAFMKGGGQGGRMERNLVVCAPDVRFQAVGHQVGLSFGGGRTDGGTLRDQQTRLEHVQGVAADNVVLNCNDSALDVNESAAIELRNNVLLGSGGVLARGKGSSARWLDGIASRPGYAMPGNELQSSGVRRWTPSSMDAKQVLEHLNRLP